MTLFSVLFLLIHISLFIPPMRMPFSWKVNKSCSLLQTCAKHRADWLAWAHGALVTIPWGNYGPHAIVNTLRKIKWLVQGHLVSIWWSLDLISQLPVSQGIRILVSTACGRRDSISGKVCRVIRRQTRVGNRSPRLLTAPRRGRPQTSGLPRQALLSAGRFHVASGGNLRPVPAQSVCLTKAASAPLPLGPPWESARLQSTASPWAPRTGQDLRDVGRHRCAKQTKIPALMELVGGGLGGETTK